jgi:hypothetical protein
MPVAGALDDGALDDGALDDGAEEGAEVGSEGGAELDGVLLPELLPLELHAASNGTLTPARPAIAAPRSTVRRSRRVSIARASFALLSSSLIELDLHSLQGK